MNCLRLQVMNLNSEEGETIFLGEINANRWRRILICSQFLLGVRKQFVVLVVGINSHGDREVRRL